MYNLHEQSKISATKIFKYNIIKADTLKEYKKRVKLQGADNQYRFAELSSVRLPSNKWIPVDTTLSYNMI